MFLLPARMKTVQDQPSAGSRSAGGGEQVWMKECWRGSGSIREELDYFEFGDRTSVTACSTLTACLTNLEITN